MDWDWNLYVAGTLAVAAALALIGTNAQARLSRERLLMDKDPLVLMDKDPLVAEAGQVWRPGPRWLYRDWRRRAAVEEELRQDPERATRYDRLSTELFAWNALETSVALVFIASVIAAVATLVD